MTLPVTMAQLDPGTQERATAVFNQFCAVYGLAAKLFRADEVGMSAYEAAAARGAADPGFQDRMWGLLLRSVHLKMSEYACRGQHLPCSLPESKYATLRRALEQRFGPLSETAPLLTPEDDGTSETPLDPHSADEQLEAMLRARPITHAEIDPEVAKVLRG
ncbi:MAG: hypothetical protein U0359_23880 [Byssovorax sp.]